MKHLPFLLLFSGLLLCTGTVYSDETEMKGIMYAGLNVPGLSFGYGISDKMVVEAKAQSQDNVTVMGLRLYRYFSSAQKIDLFYGAEIDTLTFKGTSSEGTGSAMELFFGGLYKATEKIMVSLDLGPAIIALADRASSVSSNGTEFVVNISVNYRIK